MPPTPPPKKKMLQKKKKKIPSHQFPCLEQDGEFTSHFHSTIPDIENLLLTIIIPRSKLNKFSYSILFSYRDKSNTREVPRLSES